MLPANGATGCGGRSFVTLDRCGEGAGVLLTKVTAAGRYASSWISFLFVSSLVMPLTFFRLAFKRLGKGLGVEETLLTIRGSN